MSRDQSPADDESLRESAATKRYFHGTHRVCTPEETLARLQPLLRPMGITRIANVTGLDRTGIPVVMVCRPNARSVTVSQGKGLTLNAALLAKSRVLKRLRQEVAGLVG